MTDSNPPLSPSVAPARRSGCGRYIFLCLILLLLTGGLVIWKFEDWAKAGIAWVSELPARFVTQDLTQTFRQSITEITSNHGDVLEVAVMRTDETLTRHDAKSVFSNMLSLGTTTAEIRTPVVYRYHIKLSDPWCLRIEGTRCIVEAPALRPSLPPAIETQGMEKRSEAGWFRFNAAENLAQLEKDLTPTLQQRAWDKSHIDLVREPSRKSIAEFVQKWLLNQHDGSTDKLTSIVVLFPDETAKPGETPATAPALEISRP
ncbi:MAG TPA: hypothetical protein VD994_01110 [Prosthecobacter sp.]|nr:hypothetical protein [Prosthecobacter sp.]